MITADPRLREELRLCRDMGIPHSRFLSWPELDQDKAIALVRVEADTCPGCGTRPEEWEPAQGGDRNAYVATVHVCPGCQARGDAEREMQRRDDQSSGRYVALLPRAMAEERRLAAERKRAARAARMSGAT